MTKIFEWRLGTKRVNDFVSQFEKTGEKKEGKQKKEVRYNVTVNDERWAFPARTYTVEFLTRTNKAIFSSKDNQYVFTKQIVDDSQIK